MNTHIYHLLNQKYEQIAFYLMEQQCDIHGDLILYIPKGEIFLYNKRYSLKPPRVLSR